MVSEERELWRCILSALLLVVDGVERFLHIEPRTSEIRKMWRGEHKG